jgi:predicted deacylase/environmental stress-induced protein Ves
MPWKNGLGTSAEIAVVPPNCDFTTTPFIWRVSVAEIGSSTTFSVFHAYNRVCVRLDGEELKLKHNFSSQIVTVPVFQPYSFKGEWHTQCLISNDKKVMDFYVIWQRDQAKADVQAKEITPENRYAYTIKSKGTTLIYCYTGQVSIASGEGRPDFTAKTGETFEINVWEDKETKLQISSTCPSKIILVQLVAKVEGNPDLSPNEEHTYDSSAMWKIWNVSETEEETTTPRESSKESKSKPRSGPRGRGRLVRRDSILFEHCGQAQVYQPPSLRSRFLNESEVPPAVVKDELRIDDFPKGEVRTAWITLARNGLGEGIRVPVMVARGLEDGPTLGVTAAVHGNELNGVPCIHRVIAAIDVRRLRGTVVGVPCVNIVGYLRMQRGWSDGVDLNRHFPGKKTGMASEMFCYAFMERIVKGNFNYLIDLHTASFGRINSYYVRADMNEPGCRTLALLQQPQIILHDSGQDGTLRGAAMQLGINAITVEIGNPQLLQHQFVQWTTTGIMNVLEYLKMFNDFDREEEVCTQPLICSRGYWVYTTTGGLLEVYPGVNTLVKKGDLIARMKNIFGNYVQEYYAEEDGVIIGRSSNPVANTGDRIIHLGVPHPVGQPLPKAGHEHY